MRAAHSSSAVRPAQAGYIDAGIRHTCAILADHTLRCWGKGLAGRLGYGSDATILSAAAAPPVNLGPGRYALAIAAGDFHTCAILDDHTVKCWGFGANGRLGLASGCQPRLRPDDDLRGQAWTHVGGDQRLLHCLPLGGGDRSAQAERGADPGTQARPLASPGEHAQAETSTGTSVRRRDRTRLTAASVIVTP